VPTKETTMKDKTLLYAVGALAHAAWSPEG